MLSNFISRSPAQNKSTSRRMPSKFLNVFSGKYVTQAETYSGLFHAVAEKLGGSFPGATYEKEKTSPNPKTSDKKQWIGKPGFIHENFNDIDIGSLSIPAFCEFELKVRLNTISEKIAFDLYDLLSMDKYLVPKTRVALLPWINEYIKDKKLLMDLVNKINRSRPENSKLDKGLHILSRKVEGYRDLNKAMVMDAGKKISFCKYIFQAKRPPEEIIVDGETLPLVGFMEILAISKLLNDIDVLGGDASNIGFLIEETANGRIARAVKIDPGLAFSRDTKNMFLNAYELKKNGELRYTPKADPLANCKDFQLSTSGRVIIWDKLSHKQKIDFLVALDYVIKQLADDSILDFMIFRHGRFNALGKTLTIKSKYIQELITAIKKSINELQEVYTDGLKYIAANPQQITNNIRTNSTPSLSSTNSLNKDKELVEIEPGPLSILRHIEYVLDNWVNGTLSLSRLFDSKEAKNRRNEARKRIIECYKSQQPILDLSNLGLNTLPDSLFAYFEHLTEFNLSNNQLTILPNNIDKLVRLKILDIDNNPLNIDSYIKLYNQTRGLDIKLRLNQTQDFNAILDIWINENGCSKEEKESRIKAKAKFIKCYQGKEKVLYLTCNNLSNLPKRIFTHLAFLEELYLEDEKLRSLPNGIEKLTNLPVLSLYINQLVGLPDYIKLYNQIKDLDIKLRLNQAQEFIYLNINLNIILDTWINENNCSKEEKKSRIKSKTKIIECYRSRNEELNLSYNNLSNLPEGIFTHVTFLKKLSLYNNKLEELPNDIGRLASLSEL